MLNENILIGYINENMNKINFKGFKKLVNECSTQMLKDERSKSDLIRINIPEFVGDAIWNKTKEL